MKAATELPLPTELEGVTVLLTGLDQVNVRLARSLAARGEADVILTIDGKMANTVRVNVQ
ncbi:MAG: hypothetical protein ACREEM_32170 [Blastocatellia bacterium]